MTTNALALAEAIERRAALYPSLTIMTALKESDQVGNLQPTTLVSYEADLEHVFDCRDHTAVQAQGKDAAALADPTGRDQMRSAGKARTQTFALGLPLTVIAG